MLHDVGEYEASLIEHYRGVHARLSPPTKLKPKRSVPKPVKIYTSIPEPWPPYAPVAIYDHCEGGDIILEPVAKPWKQIASEVCLKYGVTLLDIKGLSRSTIQKIARHELFYRLRHERKLTFAEIGELLGGFDHTTVRHGCIKHGERLAKR